MSSQMLGTTLLIIGVSMAFAFGMMFVVMTSAKAGYTRRMNHVKERVQRHGGTCSVCGGRSWSWGVVSAQQFTHFRHEAKMMKLDPIVAFRCGDCGNIMLFTDTLEGKRDDLRSRQSFYTG